MSCFALFITGVCRYFLFGCVRWIEPTPVSVRSRVECVVSTSDILVLSVECSCIASREVH